MLSATNKGRPTKDYTPVLLNEIIDRYKDNFFVNNTFCVPKRNHVVYLKLQDEIRKKMTLQVPTAPALNRWVIRYKIELTKKWSDLSFPLARLSSESASSISSSSTIQSSSSIVSGNEISTKCIQISQNTWNDIRPKSYLSEYGKKNKMGNNWTNIIAEHAENQLKIGCVLRLNYKNKTIFATASCRLCDCLLHFHTPKEDSGNAEKTQNIQVDFIRRPDPTKHDSSTKRKTAGSTRKEISKQIENEKPLKFYEDLISKNNGSSPLIPNLDVLRKIRSQKKSELKVCEDQYKAIRLLNRSIKFNGFVRYLLQEPFFALIYWLQSQEDIIRNAGDYYISIDATGSVAQNPIRNELKHYERPPIKQKPVFFYLAMLKSTISHKSIPITQMLSQNHTAQFITTWLKMFWTKSTAKPFEVRIDCSPTLMLSSAQTFNNSNTNEYLHNSYLSLNENKMHIKTIIRLDKSHVVKIFHNLATFKSSQCGKSVKYFYVNVLKRLIEEVDFKIIQDVSKNIFIAMMSGFECKELIKSINKICEYTGKVENAQEAEEEIELKSMLGDEEESEDLDDFWCTKLYDKVQNELENVKYNETKPNPYFLPSMKSDILRILKLTPMWTAIMSKLENRLDVTCTSSAVESQFNIIKNIIFDNFKLPVRVDIFLELYLNHIKAQCIIFKETNQDRSVNDQVKSGIELNIKECRNIIPTGSILTCDAVGEEEWRGENKKSNLNVFESQLNVPMRSNNFTISVGIRSLQFYALCGLNSIFHSLFFIFLKNDLGNFSTAALSDIFLSLINSHLAKDNNKADQQMYEIITQFEEVLDFQTESVNCEMGIVTAIDKVIKENIIVKCKTCHNSKSMRYLTFFFNDASSLMYLQTRVNDVLVLKCHKSKCHETYISTDNLLFIELSVANELGKIRISDIPSRIDVKEATFEIGAVIIYTVNHFKSLVFYKNRVIELDDLIGRPILRRKNLNVTPQFCIYVRKN